MSILNNELSPFALPSASKKGDQTKAPKRVISPEEKEKKFSTPNGQAEITIQENSVCITNLSNGIIVNNYGTLIDGKIHLGRVPSDIRISGFWVLNDKLLTGLPSTVYTPIPTLVYKEPPTIKYAQKFMKLLKALG